MQGVIRKVFGEKARFCDEGCCESFRCDRKHGLIYGAVWDGPPSKGGKAISWEQNSIESGTCAYCGADLTKSGECVNSP